MDEKLRETTNLLVELMDSKRQVKGPGLAWYKFAFAVVNVMLNLLPARLFSLQELMKLNFSWVWSSKFMIFSHR